jgi:hypothetical protein
MPVKKIDTLPSAGQSSDGCPIDRQLFLGGPDRIQEALLHSGLWRDWAIGRRAARPAEVAAEGLPLTVPRQSSLGGILPLAMGVWLSAGARMSRNLKIHLN